ncbi:MFS transporter [Streptomyces noursei]|uniref:MFS transporter n=1 Tax=Streptomyces noursei TaxID=1971 RepID=UPI0021A2904B|nr:MFS transporter [Streptomyces noursei]UWS70001.1 MFS transporter [Streptomyces noursei]
MSTQVELTRPRRNLILAVCCTSVFLGNLNNTVLNVALPAMQRDLRSPLSGLQWTTDAYLIVLAALLMLAGSAGDRIGRRRVFQAGPASSLSITTGVGRSLVARHGPAPGLHLHRSVFCFAPSSRSAPRCDVALNGGSSPMFTLSAPRERARAIGVWGAVMGVAMAVGPMVGGALVQGIGWRSIFWLNLPIGLAALVCAARFVPESRAPRPRRLDPVGQFLVIVLMGCLTYAIIEGPNTGWTAPRTLGCAVAALVALLALLRYESRRHEPLVDLRLFRSAGFSGASAMAVCSFFVLGGFLFLNTLYLQNVRNLSALVAGLFLLPMAVMNILTSPLSGRLTANRGPRLPLLLSTSRHHISGAARRNGDALHVSRLQTFWLLHRAHSII